MIKRNSHYLSLIFLIAWVLITVGCRQNEQPPPPPPVVHPTVVKVRPPVQKQQSTVKTVENIAPASDFNNRKDPFKSFVAPQAQAARPITLAKAADLLPIQSYDLSKFKVAGIIVGLKENRALVIDPAGKGYVLKQGMLIGDNNGRISRITATTVVVVENYRDDNRRISKRTVKLTLPQKK
jgi:type IV pilus assembly protein PilP